MNIVVVSTKDQARAADGQPSAHSVAWIQDVTTSTFMNEVIERSHQMPVLIDYWAEWCAPCKQLMPVLDKLAKEYGGAFFLAKINVEQEPAIASKMAVQSLPVVQMLKQGKVVSEFSGAQPEMQVRDFLHAFVQSPIEQTLQQISLLQEQGRMEEAIRLAEAELHRRPEQPELLLKAGWLYLHGGAMNKLEEALTKVPPNHHALEDYKQLKSRLRFAKRAAGLSHWQEMAAESERQPDNLEAKIRLGVSAIAAQEYDQAANCLLQVVRDDLGFHDGEAQKLLIELFDMLGAAHPVTRSYRRDLYAELH